MHALAVATSAGGVRPESSAVTQGARRAAESRRRNALQVVRRWVLAGDGAGSLLVRSLLADTHRPAVSCRAPVERAAAGEDFRRVCPGFPRDPPSPAAVRLCPSTRRATPASGSRLRGDQSRAAALTVDERFVNAGHPHDRWSVGASGTSGCERPCGRRGSLHHARVWPASIHLCAMAAAAPHPARPCW